MISSARSREQGLKWPLTRFDLAGAFGDIGVLFPIAIALISLNHMNPTAVFLTVGLIYILAGTYFHITMAVQPLKAVAALALALALPPTSIAGAGLLMGILLAFIGITNLVTPLAKLFTLPIVRGIQLGLGLILAREGLRLVFGHASNPLVIGKFPISTWIIGLGGLAILLTFQSSRRFPAALVLLGAGMLLGSLARGRELPSLDWGPVPIHMLHPQIAELKRVLTLLVIPQFALTFGNSIVATENTAQVLYGPQARRVTARALTMSIGLMNLASGMLLSAPSCHGSGGLTAHYKFGARSPKSSIIMGSACLLLALFGRAAVGVLTLIPTAVLGVFLIYVGIQHAALLRDIIRNRKPLLIASCVGVVSGAATNLTLGFLVGFLLEGVLWVSGRVHTRRGRTIDATKAGSVVTASCAFLSTNRSETPSTGEKLQAP